MAAELIDKKTSAFRVKMGLIGRRTFAGIRKKLKTLDVDEKDNVIASPANRTLVESVILDLTDTYSRFNNKDIDNAFSIIERTIPQVTALIVKEYSDKVVITDKARKKMEGQERVTKNAISRLAGPSNMRDNILGDALKKMKGSIRDTSSLDKLINEAEQSIQNRLERALAPSVSSVLSVHARKISDQLAGLSDLLTFALYSGPKNSKNRSFCAARVGKHFTEKQVTDWANLTWDGKTPATDKSTIAVELGGFNCFHSLLWVTKEEAKNKGGTITRT